MDILGRFRNKTWLTTANLTIRGATLAGKFLFIIFLAKHLTTDQLGIWGIFTTSIALSLYVVGLDFYTYSTRNILEISERDRSPMLRDQFIFYILSYIALFPILSMLFIFKVIEIKFAFFFYLILIFEHLAQEAYRTFVVFSKPVAANMILFLRTGSWTYLLLVSWILGVDDLKTLKSVFLFWMGGGLAAIILALILFTRFKFKSVKDTPVNWKWIRQGIGVSLLFFVGTVGYKIIEFADRYFIDYYHTKEDVGIYTFYANLCNIIETFVHTAVIIIFSPRLIESFHRSSTQYSTTHFQFAKQVLIYTILAGIGLGLLIIPILHFLNNDEFVEYMNVFIMLALSKMVLNLSLIFHYILYVRKNDLSIIKATIFAALVNIALNFILIPSMGISGAALATLLSFIIILGMKIYYSRGLPEAKQIIYFRFMKSRN